MSDDRTKRGLRDLILSLAVVGVFVAFLFVAVWRPSPDPVRTVDPVPMLQAAREQAEYPVLAPTGLSEQWRPTSARFDVTDGSSTWFLGYVTPEGQYVAVTQTDGDPADFISEQTVQGVPDGERTIEGRQWQQYASGDQLSLVLTDDTSTTVVTGTVSFEALEQFIGKLST